MFIVRRAVFFMWLPCIFPINAYAYLDPGTGSFFFQLIIAAILGGLFTLKLFWVKIKSAFLRAFPFLKKRK